MEGNLLLIHKRTTFTAWLLVDSHSLLTPPHTPLPPPGTPQKSPRSEGANGTSKKQWDSRVAACTKRHCLRSLSFLLFLTEGTAGRLWYGAAAEAAATSTSTPIQPSTSTTPPQAGGLNPRDFEISRFLEGAPTEEPRSDASNARSQRPATRAINWRVSCSCLCVETPVAGCRPQVFCTAAPVIHPVRVHKCPCQTS
jgi:hypothetical protein